MPRQGISGGRGQGGARQHPGEEKRQTGLSSRSRTLSRRVRRTLPRRPGPARWERNGRRNSPPYALSCPRHSRQRRSYTLPSLTTSSGNDPCGISATPRRHLLRRPRLALPHVLLTRLQLKSTPWPSLSCQLKACFLPVLETVRRGLDALFSGQRFLHNTSFWARFFQNLVFDLSAGLVVRDNGDQRSEAEVRHQLLTPLLSWAAHYAHIIDKPSTVGEGEGFEYSSQFSFDLQQRAGQAGRGVSHRWITLYLGT